MRYRLSQQQKESISENLIAFMNSETVLSNDAVRFIGNWILSGPEEKTKAFYDVWDIVLRNYMPQTRPILFRSCTRLTDGKITSFTGRLSSAHRFSKGKGFLLICDTNELLPARISTLQKRGEYHNTFFSIGELLKKEAKSPTCQFSAQLINDYAEEDEFIMRANLTAMSSLKWFEKMSA